MPQQARLIFSPVGLGPAALAPPGLAPKARWGARNVAVPAVSAPLMKERRGKTVVGWLHGIFGLGLG